MGDIGSRQVRYEVLPTSSDPERGDPRVESAAVPDDAPLQHRARLAKQAEPARS